MARLYAGLVLGRIGGSMVAVTLILFVPARYHPPQLAGATAFFSIFPRLVLVLLCYHHRRLVHKGGWQVIKCAGSSDSCRLIGW